MNRSAYAIASPLPPPLYFSLSEVYYWYISINSITFTFSSVLSTDTVSLKVLLLERIERECLLLKEARSIVHTHTHALTNTSGPAPLCNYLFEVSFFEVLTRGSASQARNRLCSGICADSCDRCVFPSRRRVSMHKSTCCEQSDSHKSDRQRE